MNYILLITGGLSVFLFGLNLMRDSLTKISSPKIKTIIEKTAGTKLKSLLIGILITALIQSSSGVTAIVVALISSRLLSFKNGVMVMIGANIGTTATAFLFTLNIENYSLFIIIIGTILYLFKNRTIKNAGSIINGLGILFLGLYLLNSGLKIIIETTDFLDVTLHFSDNTFLGLLSGTIISTLIQSSSATIGIIQCLYSLNSIALGSAIALMLGANIGTTIASLIVTISASKEAKTAVYINIIFNAAGALLFLFILTPITDLFNYLELSGYIPSKKLTIAYSHLLFNTLSTVLFYLLFDFIINNLFITKKNNLTQMY